MVEPKKAEKARPTSPSSESSPSSQSRKKGGLKIKLVRSVIGADRYQREVVRGLGLRRINHVVERADTPEIRGMLAKVPHLVELVDA